MNSWLLIITLYGGNGTVATVDMNPQPTLAACELEGQSIVDQYSYMIGDSDPGEPEALKSIKYDCSAAVDLPYQDKELTVFRAFEQLDSTGRTGYLVRDNYTGICYRYIAETEESEGVLEEFGCP